MDQSSPGMFFECDVACDCSTQATIRGIGVYASVELFDDILEEIYGTSADIEAVSTLARVQMGRAVGVAIVVHGSMHPSMELLLRHTLDKLDLLDMKIVAEPGTLDDRDGFIVDLGKLQEQDVTEEMFEIQNPIDDMVNCSDTVDDPSQQMFDMDEEEANGQPGTKKLVKLRRSSRPGAENSFDNGEGELTPKDLAAVLCVHLGAYVLDGDLDGVELELWEQVCEKVGPTVAIYRPERIAYLCTRFREVQFITAKDLHDCFEPDAEMVIPWSAKFREYGYVLSGILSA